MGDQYVFTKENVVSIERVMTMNLCLGLRISCSGRFAPSSVTIRTLRAEQLIGVLWAALDAEYEHVY